MAALLPFTVLIADDHGLVREGLKALVVGLLGRARVIEAHDGKSLMEHVSESAPAIRLALIDLKMPGMRGGLQLVDLARKHPHIPVIVVSALESPDVIRWVMGIPTVRAYVPKSGSTYRIRVAIEAAVQGRAIPPQEPVLTTRQQEIAVLMRKGLSNKTIARTLGISEGTVKNHVTQILRALRVTNRTQAAQVGFEIE